MPAPLLKPVSSRGESRSGSEGVFAGMVRQEWLYVALLVLCTLIVYLPVHQHPFAIADDEQYVVNNPHLQLPLGWETVRWAFTSFDLANWHPITWLSHAVDVHYFKLDPAGHHDVNLFLHVLNTLLLFSVLRRATGANGRSFIVAMLFALHPVNVETVAWVAERKSLLSAFFFLLALGAYGDYVANPGWRRYAGVAALYALGLMAKPQIITFPSVLLLWDYWPLGRMNAPVNDPRGRTFAQLFLEKLPLFALSAASAVMTLKAQSAAGALRYYPLSARTENAIVAYVRYLGNALWPLRLSPFYPHTPFSFLPVAGAGLLLVVITVFVLARRRERYLATGWFWYLGTLVPMIGIVQVGEQALADRYAYLSFIGLFVMIGWGIAGWAERRHIATRWIAAPALLALIALAIVTDYQLSYWSNNVTLWTRALTLSNHSAAIEENLGVALLEAGKPDDAMTHFERVVAMSGNGASLGREQAGYAAVAHLYLGAFAQQQGWLDGCIEHYKAVLALADEFTAGNVYANVPPVLVQIKATALTNLGYVYNGVHNLEDSRASFQAALKLDPRSAREWVGLGVVEEKSGNIGDAVEAFSRAAALQHTDVNLLLLAQALERDGQVQQARAIRQRAMMASRDLQAAELAADKLTHQ